MCTILFLYRVHPEFPLVLAANRDEFYARPSEGPRLLRRSPRVLAGLDLRAGGTWMGANEHGVAVGLTNQRTWRDPSLTARSRGEVVERALGARSPDEIVEQLRALDPSRYNAFNLLFGNAEALFAAYARPDTPRVEIEAAPTGVHVLPNDRIGAPGFPKAERARAMAAVSAETAWPELAERLAAVLGDHHRPPIEEVAEPPRDSAFDREGVWHNEQMCTHGEAYGTRSSSIIALRRDTLAHYWFAEGPPCVTPFEERVHLIAEST